MKSVILVLFLSFVACSDEPPPPPTEEEVIEACHEYGRAACAAFGRCLDWSDQEIQGCTADEQGRCATELEDPSCWTDQRDAYERCSDIESESCESVCGDDGFCFDYCPYFCPSPPPPDGGSP